MIVFHVYVLRLYTSIHSHDLDCKYHYVRIMLQSVLFREKNHNKRLSSITVMDSYSNAFESHPNIS